MNSKVTPPRDIASPFTLREALNFKVAIPRTGPTMDLTIAKLQDLVAITKKDYAELSNSQYTQQGLALNKISNLQLKLEELISSLESDIE